MKVFVIIPLLMLILVSVTPFSDAQSVPDWVKNTAGWWATDVISEKEFVNAIEFLIRDDIIHVSVSQSTVESQGVPDWVKNTAGWWATDVISEKEFVNAIEFLVNTGIIQTESDSKCVKDILKFFNDKEKIIDVCKKHDSNITELIPYEIEASYNSHGFPGDEFSQEKPEGVYRIFMIGGSTMRGVETTNDTTIPSIMQKMFNSEDLNLQVEVINAAISGGNVASEKKLISEKILNYDPDLIIMYDGWNDLSADYPIDATIFYMEEICKEAYVENFNVIFTLQPIAGFGNKILTEQERINSLTGEDHNGFQLIQGKSTYDWLAKEMQILNKIIFTDSSNPGPNPYKSGEGICESYDLRGSFDEVNGAVYWDQGHMLHTGNMIIAEKFFEIAMEKIDSEFIPDKKFKKIISDYNSIPIITYLFEKLGISDETFQSEFRDIKTIPSGKGNFFGLKAKFNGDIEGIFVGKDLRGIDLDEINLDGQDLTGANLSGMDLRGIDFSNANLKNVNLKDAIIGKTIQFVEFDDDCSHDEFVSDMAKQMRCMKKIVENESIRTNFHNADLTNTQFGRSDGSNGTIERQIISFSDFSGANLTNSNISYVEFQGCNFESSVLDGVFLEDVKFLKANFDDADIKNFNFELTWFQDSTFINTKLTNGNIKALFLVNTDLGNANLDGINYTGSKGHTVEFLSESGEQVIIRITLVNAEL